MAGCHDYFQKIKPNIIKVLNIMMGVITSSFPKQQGYLKQHRKIAEEHIADVERHYSKERQAMDAKVEAVSQNNHSCKQINFMQFIVEGKSKM